MRFLPDLLQLGIISCSDSLILNSFPRAVTSWVLYPRRHKPRPQMSPAVMFVWFMADNNGDSALSVVCVLSEPVHQRFFNFTEPHLTLVSQILFFSVSFCLVWFSALKRLYIRGRVLYFQHRMTFFGKCFWRYYPLDELFWIMILPITLTNIG